MTNIDLKSTFIGVFATISMFLIMAQKQRDSLIFQYEKEMYKQLNTNLGDYKSKIGKYQITSNSQTQKLYLLDTRTGETFSSIYGEEWIQEIDILRKN